MVAPTPPHLSPEQRDAWSSSPMPPGCALALSPSPKPPPARHRSRSRQYPGGRPNPWRTARGRRWG
jgi:hypothetical protein